LPSEEALDGEYVGDCDELLRREVRKACIELADYKRPRYFALWDGEFPRTATLKIKKHEVRKRLDEIPLTSL